MTEIFGAIIVGLIGSITAYVIYRLTKRDNKREVEEKTVLRELKSQQKIELKTRKDQLDYLKEQSAIIKKSKTNAIPKTYELLIIGRPQSGKTQIIWTAQGKSEEPKSTIKKTIEELPRPVTINSKKYIFHYLIPDIGGEDVYLGDVNEELLVRKPPGILFVVDNNSGLTPDFSEERSQEHMRTIYSILGILGNPKRNRCKVVLFLINKQDIWSKKFTDEQMLEKFTEHVAKFDKIGKTVIVECICAKTGANLNQALSKFEKMLVSRKPREKKPIGDQNV